MTASRILPEAPQYLWPPQRGLRHAKPWCVAIRRHVCWPMFGRCHRLSTGPVTCPRPIPGKSSIARTARTTLAAKCCRLRCWLGCQEAARKPPTSTTTTGMKIKTWWQAHGYLLRQYRHCSPFWLTSNPEYRSPFSQRGWSMAQYRCDRSSSAEVPTHRSTGNSLVRFRHYADFVRLIGKG
jgi:hypothetical protein